MTNPSDERKNPFEAPTVNEPPRHEPAQGRRASAMAFIHLSFQFKLVGGILLFVGLLLTGAVLWLGGLLIAGGAAFVVTGYAIGSYKPWGWYAAAVLVVPLLVIVSVLALAFAVSYTGIFAIVALVVVSLYCYHVTWTLFSSAGRQRYEDSVRAIAAAKANPDSIAGRLYRKK